MQEREKNKKVLFAAAVFSVLMGTALLTKEIILEQVLLYQRSSTSLDLDHHINRRILKSPPHHASSAEVNFEADADTTAELTSFKNTVVGSWILALGSAIAIKLTSSIDDVVWLAPFMNVSRAKKLTHSAIYIWVMLFQAVLALAISRLGEAGLDTLVGKSQKGWSSDKILTVAAGSSLLVYGLYLAHEYYQELQEDGDDEEERATSGEEEGLVGKKIVEAYDGDDSKEDNKKDELKRKQFSTQSLFVVAFLGSLDDLTLFVPMLVGQAFGWVQLFVGVLVASVIILGVCIFITLCKPVANFLEKVPLAAIVLVFSTFLLVKGFSMK